MSAPIFRETSNFLLHVLIMGALSLLIGGLAPVQAQDLVVNDGTVEAGAGEPCKTRPDYGTIQAAVDNATAGQTILVCPATYAEEVNVDKALTLNGPYAGTAFNGQSLNRGGEAVVQPPSGAAFHIGADNVTIDGFTLDGQGNVFFGVNNFDTSAGTYEAVTNFTLTNTIVRDFQGYGVSVCNGTSRCTGDPGQATTGLTTGGAVTNNRFDGIDGLSTTDGDGRDSPGRAISMETDGIIETVTGNVIRTSNPATGQNQYGILASNQGRGSDASSVTLTFTGNDIDVDDVGIWVNNHDGDTPGVRVENNTVVGKEGIRLLNLTGGTALEAQGNTVEADTLGMRVQTVTVDAPDPFAVSGNTLTFPNGQEFDGDDSGAIEGDALGEQVVGIQVGSLRGSATPVFEDNVLGASGADGPFYGYSVFDVQAGAPAEIRQTSAVTGASISGVQQGVFLFNTTDFNTVAGSNVVIDGLVMDDFTGTSPNDGVNFHAGVFVFTIPPMAGPSALLSTTIRDVKVENTGIAGGTSAPPTGCSDASDEAASKCGGQASAGLYFGDFGSTANVRQRTTVERATLTGNDNRGVFLRGPGAEATVTQSTFTDNGDAPFTAGGNHGYSAIARVNGRLAIGNSLITGPSSVTTSGSPGDNDLLQESANGQLLVAGSALDRNGVGDFTSGAVNASGNVWLDGGTVVSPAQVAGLSGTTDYTPWLVSAADTGTGTPGFQGDRSVLATDSGSPQLQSETRIEEAAGLGGSDALRLEQTGSSSYDVPNDVTLQGDLVIPQNLSFGTVAGAIQIVNAELIVDPIVTSVSGGAGTPTFDVQNRFVGTDGPGNDQGWRILAAPRVGMTGADIGQTLAQASSGSILYTWDGTQQGFVQEDLTSSSDLSAGEGFFLYLFDIDGRDRIDSNPSCASGAACIRTKAELDLGTSLLDAFGVADVNVDIDGEDNPTATEAGYVLGNPFAQSFDVGNLVVSSRGSDVIGTAGQFVASVQVWNPQTEMFEVINADPTLDTAVAPWQGFWVLRTSTSDLDPEMLTFESAGRTSGAPFIPAKSMQPSSVESGILYVTMDVEDSSGSTIATSEASIYARSGATLGNDVYDAPRITPPNASYAQVSFVREGDSRRQAQHSVPYDLSGYVEIPLYAEAVGLSGTATLSTEAWTNVPADWALTLEDTETGAQTSLVPGETYEFDLTGSGSSGGLGGGVQDEAVSSPRFIVRTGPKAPLPVELARFTGQAEGQAALLSWTTVSETNNTGFNVQQQTGDGSYETVRFVEGAGTTDAPQSYEVRLEDLSYGTHTFRLEQVDADGAATASAPVGVQVRLQEAMAVTPVAPNPVRGQGTARVTVRETQAVQAVLYDALGRRVRTIYDGELQGQQPKALQVEASTLASGMYFLRVQGETTQHASRFVVVR